MAIFLGSLSALGAPSFFLLINLYGHCVGIDTILWGSRLHLQAIALIQNLQHFVKHFQTRIHFIRFDRSFSIDSIDDIAIHLRTGSAHDEFEDLSQGTIIVLVSVNGQLNIQLISDTIGQISSNAIIITISLQNSIWKSPALVSHLPYLTSSRISTISDP